MYVPVKSLTKNGINTIGQGATQFQILDGVFNPAAAVVKMKILDKGFVTQKEYKKNVKWFESALPTASDLADTYRVKITAK